jgi:hypothetical protein
MLIRGTSDFVLLCREVGTGHIGRVFDPVAANFTRYPLDS